MNYIFLDTNIFLQCKSLAQLAWEDISDRHDVVLLIPQAVRREIDKLKSDGNGRRSKRARSANSFFREIIRENGGAKKISNGKISVEIAFPPPIQKEQRKEDDFLDPSVADDLIILDILAYKEIFPDRDVRFLTHDINPLLSARNYGIQCIEIPDNWLLDPEPDEKDKKIKELEGHIKDLKKSSPEIIITVNEKSAEIEPIVKIVKTYAPLENCQIDSIVGRIKIAHPIEVNFSEQNSSMIKIGMSLQKYVPPSKEDIERYQKKLYPAWIEEIENMLATAHERVEPDQFTVDLSFSIKNIGASPANNIIVKVSVSDGLLLLPPIDEDDVGEDDKLEIPSPPVSPKGEYEGIYGSALSRLARSGIFASPYAQPIGNIGKYLTTPRINRDRNAFYWKPERHDTPVAAAALECAEFRHRVGQEDFEFSMSISKSGRPRGGMATVTVSATNLHDPVIMEIPLRISYEEGDTVSSVLEALGIQP